MIEMKKGFRGKMRLQIKPISKKLSVESEIHEKSKGKKLMHEKRESTKNTKNHNLVLI